MSEPARSLRVAIADDERETVEYLQEMLTRMGHQVATARTGKELAELCRLFQPDLIITDIRMPDMDGIDAVTEVSKERATPVILVSAHHDAELLTRAAADHIMAYLIKPVREAEVKTAITLAMVRFEQFRAVLKEAHDLRQALEDRKQIERAKGAVMRRLALGEQEAFRQLKKLSSDHNWKLVQVAQRVLQAEEVFQQLEKSEAADRAGGPPGSPGV